MKNLIIILFFVFAICSNAQNIVQNPSFETFSNCPDNMTQIGYAVPWFSPLSPVSTSDYFNACDLTNFYSVPWQDGFNNYQNARSGFAMAGLNLYNGSTWREYIEVSLINPLVANNTYCVNFYVNLVTGTTWGIDAIGAYLSPDSVLSVLPVVLPYIPQINNPTNNIIIDTVNWVKISGSYTASGGERYITIGNFLSNSNVNVQNLGGLFPNTYYFIDDISVYECDATVYTAEAGSTQTVCIGTNDSVQIGTTPQSEYIYWWLPATGLSDDSIANPKVRPAVTTTYYLHQKDFKFDETVDSVTVVVEDCPANGLNIINAFTPNADGINDVFHIKGTNIKELHAKIINRWGQVLYKWDPAGGGASSNAGWDGKYNGMDVAAGAYFYVVTVVYEDDAMEEKKGALELIR